VVWVRVVGMRRRRANRVIALSGVLAEVPGVVAVKLVVSAAIQADAIRAPIARV
jgi:hypothetical protein